MCEEVVDKFACGHEVKKTLVVFCGKTGCTEVRPASKPDKKKKTCRSCRIDSRDPDDSVSSDEEWAEIS
jgi:hypothetical protein